MPADAFARLHLTKLDLSVIHGWANFVKYSPDGGWDEEDQRVRQMIYEELLPLVRGIPSRPRVSA